jgi:hypothetical protein
MTKALAHQDDRRRLVALLRRVRRLPARVPPRGENPVPIAHPTACSSTPARGDPEDCWLPRLAGQADREPLLALDLETVRVAFWDDVRLDRVLPFREARDEEDEKHVHPLQLDVIDRCLVLWSNPGERVLTPFMGVGSEVYAAVRTAGSGSASSSSRATTGRREEVRRA